MGTQGPQTAASTPLPTISKVVGAKPEALAKVSNTFKDFVAQFEKALTSVDGSMAHACVAWRGHTKDNLQPLVVEWNANMNAFNKGLAEIGNALGVVGVDYHTVNA